MEAYCAGDRPRDSWPCDDPAETDPFSDVPELPPATVARWTVRLKAELVGAVRAGWVPLDEVCQLYDISGDEFAAWERDLDRYGVPGLRTTRYQIYRDTDSRRASGVQKR